MRISLLLQREPFGAILEKTLSRFFHTQLRVDSHVTWSTKKTNNSQEKQGTWLCNPYLNVIFTPTTHKDNFKPILEEYSYATTPWKRPLQRMYCTLATHPLAARYFSKYYLNINPTIPRADNIIIIGGNHRIRLLDRQQGKCYVINKDNFDSSRTKEEIKFRQTETHLPIPKILAIATDQTWYAEQYISGTPINRIRCPQTAEMIQQKALKHIKELAKKTSSQESLQGYCLALFDKIKNLIASNSLLSAKQKQQLQQSSTTLVKQLLKQEKNGMPTITTSQTHGDFQPGNILKEKENVWLIDWEYTRRRQSGYDALVYHLKSRFGDTLQTNLKKAITDDIKGLQSWPGLPWRNQEQRITTLALFLLEELDLYLEENANKLFTQLSGGMLNFTQNFRKYIKLLQVT